MRFIDTLKHFTNPEVINNTLDIISEYDMFTNDSLKINRRKFLVEQDFLFSELMVLFRRRISDLNEAEGLYMFIGDDNKLVPLSKRVNELYNENDKFLKVTLTKENTFG